MKLCSYLHTVSSSSQKLIPCKWCNRTFAIDRISIHEEKCQERSDKPRRPAFRTPTFELSASFHPNSHQHAQIQEAPKIHPVLNREALSEPKLSESSNIDAPSAAVVETEKPIEKPTTDKQEGTEMKQDKSSQNIANSGVVISSNPPNKPPPPSQTPKPISTSNSTNSLSSNTKSVSNDSSLDLSSPTTSTSQANIEQPNDNLKQKFASPIKRELSSRSSNPLPDQSGNMLKASLIIFFLFVSLIPFHNLIHLLTLFLCYPFLC